jgi:branched-chain amino acid transport system substrate-binding protein
VDLIVDVPHSGVALAVNGVAREKNKVLMVSGAGTVELTGTHCTPNTTHMSYDTYMLARSTGGAMVEAGGKNWFFITADYAFGYDLERDTAKFVKAGGGKVLGNIRTPFPGTTDFSSFLVQAQSSGAQVIGLANAGADTINCIKQAAEFGINKSAKLAGLLVYVSDVHALGLATAQGLVLTETFYWNLSDRTRALTQRLLPKTNGARPGMSQAGTYASVLHYLRTVAEMGVAAAKQSGRDAVTRMKARPMDDDAFGPGRIREDGVAIHPAYLFEVKKPEESQGIWDYYKLIATVPADEAFKPLAETGCPLVRT